MSNPVLSAILAALKTVWSTIGNAIQDLEQHLASDIGNFGGLVSALLTAEENQIAMDYDADLKQIAVNIQNATPGLTIANFIPVFIAAATPVLVNEAHVLSGVFWNVVSTYHASNLNITNVQGNGGNLPNGVQS